MNFLFLGQTSSADTQESESERAAVKKFLPGNSIHAPDRIKYFAEVVGAGAWQLGVVRDG